ncbi:WD40 repeat protein [Phaffia rhodozyma]|uniref:WD40 repeat protein n=1 Tax=Phaffia rhodozyma TaxID=264483 RepID=A0A0F7SJH3_PHARH|nr:WD40 repeat protein [Phaffia rhodozyma]
MNNLSASPAQIPPPAPIPLSVVQPSPLSHTYQSRGLKTPDPSSWPKPKPILGGHREPVQCVSWSLDGRKLVSSSTGGDRGLRIWDAGSSGSTLDPRHSDLIPSPHASTAPISKVQWNPYHLTELVSSGSTGDGKLCFFDARLKPIKPLSTISLPTPAFQIDHHPSGDVLAVSDIKEHVSFFERRMMGSQKPVATLNPNSSSVEVAPPPPPQPVVQRPSWESSTDRTFPAPSAGAAIEIIFDIGFSSSGQDFLLCSRGGKVYVRSWASLLSSESESAKAPTYEWKAQTGSCDSIGIEKTGRYLATAGVDAIVNLWDADDYVGLKSFGDVQGEVRQLSFSQDGEMLAAGGEESVVYIFGTTERSLLAKIPTGGVTNALAWSPKHDGCDISFDHV